MKKSLSLFFSCIILFFIVSTETHASSQPKFQFYGLLYAARNNGSTPEQLSAQLNTIIPADLRENMTVSFGNSSAWNYLTSKNDYNVGNGDNYLSFCKRIDKQGFKFDFEIADPGFPVWPDNFRIPNYDSKGARIDRFSFSEAQIDSVFRTCTNCIGVKTGEVFWSYNLSEDWLIRVFLIRSSNHQCIGVAVVTLIEGEWKRFD